MNTHVRVLIGEHFIEITLACALRRGGGVREGRGTDHRCRSLGSFVS